MGALQSVTQRLPEPQINQNQAMVVAMLLKRLQEEQDPGVKAQIIEQIQRIQGGQQLPMTPPSSGVGIQTQRFAKGGQPFGPLSAGRKAITIDPSVTDPEAPTRTAVKDIGDALLTASNFYGLGLGSLAKLAAGKLAGMGGLAAMGVIKPYWHAGADIKCAISPGTFFNEDRSALEQFAKQMGAPKVNRYLVDAHRTGTETDVEKMAKRLGMFQEGTPVGQYLEQGKNAVFDNSPQLVEELRGLGFDSIILNDGISKSPSLVALDPSIAKRQDDVHKMLQMVYRGGSGSKNLPPEVFVTPQRNVAEYYAAKRSGQTGETPFIQSLMVDPFAGKKYGHAIPIDKNNQEVIVTQARKIPKEAVEGEFANGGSVTAGLVPEFKPTAGSAGLF